MVRTTRSAPRVDPMVRQEFAKRQDPTARQSNLGGKVFGIHLHDQFSTAATRRKDSVLAHGDNRVDLGLLPLDHLGNGVEISISDWTLPDMTSTRLRRTNRIICHRDLLIAAGASHT